MEQEFQNPARSDSTIYQEKDKAGRMEGGLFEDRRFILFEGEVYEIMTEDIPQGETKEYGFPFRASENYIIYGNQAYKKIKPEKFKVRELKVREF